MGDRSAISWTDATWNPVRGCSRVSEGCRHCYAERVAARFSGPGMPYEGLVRIGKRSRGIGATGPMERVPLGWNGEVRMVPEHLADPLRWRKPRRVFVNSMSDLFHEKLSNEQIAAVFGVMAASPRHTFQVLTKRAQRMRDWFRWARRELTEQQRGIVAAPNTARALLDAAFTYAGAAYKPVLDVAWRQVENDPWPLPNVWLGVSVENQEVADERIPLLLETPAVIRFLSCEPLLGPLELRSIRYPLGGGVTHNMDALKGYGGWEKPRWEHAVGWVIVGCESGPGARPADVAWFRSLRDQCEAAGVPFFLKQAHKDHWVPALEHRGQIAATGGYGAGPIRAADGSKQKPGGIVELPYLDGVQHKAMPETGR